MKSCGTCCNPCSGRTVPRDTSAQFGPLASRPCVDRFLGRCATHHTVKIHTAPIQPVQDIIDCHADQCMTVVGTDAAARCAARGATVDVPLLLLPVLADLSLLPTLRSCRSALRKTTCCGTGDVAGMSEVVGTVLQHGVDLFKVSGAAHFRAALYTLSRDLAETTDRTALKRRLGLQGPDLAMYCGSAVLAPGAAAATPCSATVCPDDTYCALHRQRLRANGSGWPRRVQPPRGRPPTTNAALTCNTALSEGAAGDDDAAQWIRPGTAAANGRQSPTKSALALGSMGSAVPPNRDAFGAAAPVPRRAHRPILRVVRPRRAARALGRAETGPSDPRAPRTRNPATLWCMRPSADTAMPAASCNTAWFRPPRAPRMRRRPTHAAPRGGISCF